MTSSLFSQSLSTSSTVGLCLDLQRPEALLFCLLYFSDISFPLCCFRPVMSNTFICSLHTQDSLYTHYSLDCFFCLCSNFQIWHFHSELFSCHFVILPFVHFLVLTFSLFEEFLPLVTCYLPISLCFSFIVQCLMLSFSSMKQLMVNVFLRVCVNVRPRCSSSLSGNKLIKPIRVKQQI